MATLEEQLLAAASGTSDNDQVLNNPLVVDLGTQKLEFKDANELSENLRQALAQVNQEVVKIRNEKELLEHKLSQNQSQGQYAESDDTEINTKFNMDHFIDQMKKDPPSALDYASGFSTKNRDLQENLKVIQELRQEAEVTKFLKAHPEFPGGQAADILNRTREELGQPMTKVGLEAAYNHAVQNNRMPDYKVQALLNQQQQQFLQYLQANNLPVPQQQQTNQVQNYQPVNNVPQNPYPVMTNQGPMGIPTVPRNQPGPNPDLLAIAENMPLDKLQKLLKDNGLL